MVESSLAWNFDNLSCAEESGITVELDIMLCVFSLLTPHSVRKYLDILVGHKGRSAILFSGAETR